IRGLQLEALGGSGTLDIEVPTGEGSTVRLAGPLKGVDAEGLLRLIFDMGAPGLAAGTTGDFVVSWPNGKPRHITGRFPTALEAPARPRTPLSGRFEWSAQKGVQPVERADLKTPETHAQLQGRIEADDRTDLALDAESTDLAVSDDLLRRIRRALGNPAADL